MEYRKIFITADGSASVYNKDGIAYHSLHGALQESEHVFINAGLKFLLNEKKNQSINIFELGFGTGLNALLTGNLARENPIPIYYETVEPFALNEIEYNQLNYGQLLQNEALFEALHQCSFNTAHQLLPNFSFKKIDKPIEDYTPNNNFDIIYFDAFAPTAQPQLWEQEVLQKMYDMLHSKGILVTYCSKGVVKRLLKQIGFVVGALPGPPKKREMIRAIKN